LKRDSLKVPIAITGMHRTGTSMVTRALHDCGLHLIAESDAELVDAAEDNPEGFWENKAIVACNDDLLEATAGAWDNPPEAPPYALDDGRVTHLADSAAAAIAALSEHERWGFKDPRTCLTAAYWLDLCPDLHFVICVRHPLEVALSLKRRNQNSYSLGLRLWERYYSTVLDLVPRERRVVTHYDTFFADADGEIARLCDFAGLSPVPPRVRRDLRHHTSGVSLIDAGVNENVRELYAALCREAGLAPPQEARADEGRVRRLILDGAVAARHAEQRQSAIDRMQQREERFRSEYALTERSQAATERELRERIRELERQVVAARTETLQRNLDDRLTRIDGHLRDLQNVHPRLRAIDGHLRDLQNVHPRLRAIDAHLRDIEPGPIGKAVRRSTRRAERGLVRFVLRPAKRALADARQTAVGEARHRVDMLPGPAQQNVRRARRLLARARREPIPTAKLVRRKAMPKARAAAKRHLPASAQKPLRRANRAYRRGRATAVPRAKQVAKHLPPSAQAPLRRAWRRVGRTRASSARHAPKPRSRQPSVPKGPAYGDWKAKYEEMLTSTMSPSTSWLMIAPGSPKDARTAHTPNATLFPRERNGQPLADDLAHVAHLEALRFEGHRYLVLPEGSRGWFERRVEFRDHVTTNYRTLADVPGAGTVFDLAHRPDAGAMSLLGAVSELAAGFVEPPAVLNLTAREIGSELPGIATFRAPTDQELPYLDHTVDIVIVEQTRDISPARRVARTGVVVVSDRASRLEVQSIEPNVTKARQPARVIVWSADPGDDKWRSQLVETVARAGAELRFAPVDHTITTVDSDDVVVVLEPFVFPLPRTLERAADLVAARPGVAHAGKSLRADGCLEAAGGTVFFDRSIALIGNASEHVRAPWHEYVRPVCWAPSIVVAAGSLWRTVRADDALQDRAFIREWCAAVWEMGGEVVYEPSLAAVRVRGEGSEPSAPLQESSWQRVLDLRPHRPSELNDGTWRYLLAHDDVQVRGA
jgi:hypothetical protein